jgi:ribonuclease Y
MGIIGIIILVLLGTGAGFGLGYFIRRAVSLGKKGSIELEIKQMMIAAKEEAQKQIDLGKRDADKIREEVKNEDRLMREGIKKEEERIHKKEALLDERARDIDNHVLELKTKTEEAHAIKLALEEKEKEQDKKLESIAGLTMDEARVEIMKRAEIQSEEDLMIRMQKLDKESQEKLANRAKEILATSIQRLASSTASEMMTTNVAIPNDDLKGKIIGKEGRNIRAFEQAAGVELIVDDAPGVIVVSSFDPVRRQIARIALENLILDGRIQPAKIEEEIEKAKKDINNIIKQKGEQAVMELGIHNLDPRIVAIVGRLYFRTSYGQNVLQHSVEMGHIAGMIASEIGADVSIAKAGALVHDIGKALDHEVQGTHIDIGIRILEKFGADKRIIVAMKSHHDDCPHETVEAVIVQTADIISGGRPGARRDTVENYLKRLQDLEAVAMSFTGVEKVWALSAGREVRVFVRPDSVTDVAAREMARDIAKKIEADLTYPGEIRVVLIRENRVVEFAR